MRSPLFAGLLVAGVLFASAAHADEPPAHVLRPQAPRPAAPRLFVSGFESLSIGPQTYGGLEVGLRPFTDLEVELDYAIREDDRSRPGSAVGAGLRWRSSEGPLAAFLYANVALPFEEGQPEPALLALHTGVGGDWTAKNGLFVQAQVGALYLPDLGIIEAEARVGVGIRF
jgi:hypothetical protein